MSTDRGQLGAGYEASQRGKALRRRLYWIAGGAGLVAVAALIVVATRGHPLWALAGLGALAAGVLATGVFLVLRRWPAHHFGVVEHGVLYRSGQPTPPGWRAIQRRCNLRTVISVREVTEDAAWYKLEEAFCREHGIELVRLPITVEPEADVRRFVEMVTDPGRQPALVHCEAGSVRTGVAVGAYRILVQGWSYEKALADARRYRFKPHRYREYAECLKRLADERSD